MIDDKVLLKCEWSGWEAKRYLWDGPIDGIMMLTTYPHGEDIIGKLDCPCEVVFAHRADHFNRAWLVVRTDHWTFAWYRFASDCDRVINEFQHIQTLFFMWLDYHGMYNYKPGCGSRWSDINTKGFYFISVLILGLVSVSDFLLLKLIRGCYAG